MSKLLAALVRHGDYKQPLGVPSAHLPHGLTEEGRAQARALGETLAARERAGEWRIAEEIDTSTLLRAWETGQIIAEVLSAQLGRTFSIASFDELSERSLGAMANLTVDTIAQIIADDPRYAPLPPGWKARSSFRLPIIGAESLLQAGARVATHVDGRLRGLAGQGSTSTSTSTGDTLKLFVSHGAALRHAAVNLGTLTLDQNPGLSMHHCQPVHLERLPSGAYRHADGAWKIRAPKSIARD